MKILTTILLVLMLAIPVSVEASWRHIHYVGYVNGVGEWRFWIIHPSGVFWFKPCNTCQYKKPEKK